jgi:uncharacterized membrane-anchored protein
MSERVRVIVLLAMTIVILGLVNLQIVDKETIVRHGAKVLIRLAPVDPRSLMQGDYMSLRFAMTNQVAAAADMARINDGVAVVELRDLGEAIFISIYDGQQLADNQHLLRFRKRGESVRIASDAFFFEEGQAGLYADAIFGELRVATDGEAVLTGLRDGAGNTLGESLPVLRNQRN